MTMQLEGKSHAAVATVAPSASIRIAILAAVNGNRVRGVRKDGTGTTDGSFNDASTTIAVRDNDLVGDGSAGSYAVSCHCDTGGARDNVRDNQISSLPLR